jgi:hypothetical protein
VDEMEELSFTATATDDDLPANSLTFSLVGAPAGASIGEDSGIFSWTPTEAQGPDSYTFAVKVCDDGDPVLCASEQVTVTVNEVNTAPVLAAIGDQNVDTLEELSFTATATDDDLPANSLTFSLVGAPAGATIGATSGIFSWTPTEAQGSNSYTFIVKACDNGTPQLCDEEDVTVLVTRKIIAPERYWIYMPVIAKH